MSRNFDRLPLVCAVEKSDGTIVMLSRGAKGFFDLPDHLQGFTVDEINVQCMCTDDQREAMLCGSMSGNWEGELCDPEYWEKKRKNG